MFPHILKQKSDPTFLSLTYFLTSSSSRRRRRRPRPRPRPHAHAHAPLPPPKSSRATTLTLPRRRAAPTGTTSRPPGTSARRRTCSRTGPSSPSPTAPRPPRSGRRRRWNSASVSGSGGRKETGNPVVAPTDSELLAKWLRRLATLLKHHLFFFSSSS